MGNISFEESGAFRGQAAVKLVGKVAGRGCCEREVFEELIDFPDGFCCLCVKPHLTSCEDIQLRHGFTAAVTVAITHCREKVLHAAFQ